MKMTRFNISFTVAKTDLGHVMDILDDTPIEDLSIRKIVLSQEIEQVDESPPPELQKLFERLNREQARPKQFVLPKGGEKNIPPPKPKGEHGWRRGLPGAYNGNRFGSPMRLAMLKALESGPKTRGELVRAAREAGWQCQNQSKAFNAMLALGLVQLTPDKIRFELVRSANEGKVA